MKLAPLMHMYWWSAILPGTALWIRTWSDTSLVAAFTPKSPRQVTPAPTTSPIQYIAGAGEDVNSDGLSSSISLDDIDMESLTKVRPYPLFVAEKISDVLEDPRKFGAKVKVNKNGDKQKERIVVLGTGWGATAFLKNIDTVSIALIYFLRQDNSVCLF